MVTLHKITIYFQGIVSKEFPHHVNNNRLLESAANYRSWIFSGDTILDVQNSESDSKFDKILLEFFDPGNTCLE